MDATFGRCWAWQVGDELIRVDGIGLGGKSQKVRLGTGRGRGGVSWNDMDRALGSEGAKPQGNHDWNKTGLVTG